MTKRHRPYITGHTTVFYGVERLDALSELAADEGVTRAALMRRILDKAIVEMTTKRDQRLALLERRMG